LPRLGSRQSTEPGLAAEQTRVIRDYEVLKQQYDQLLANREQVRPAQRRPDPHQPARPSRWSSRRAFRACPPRRTGPLFLSLIPDRRRRRGIAVAFVSGQLQTTFPTQSRLVRPDRTAGLRHAERGGDATRAPPPSSAACSGWAVAAAALGGSYAILILIEFWQRSQVA
jgi:hypothetical protein